MKKIIDVNIEKVLQDIIENEKDWKVFYVGEKSITLKLKDGDYANGIRLTAFKDKGLMFVYEESQKGIDLSGDIYDRWLTKAMEHKRDELQDQLNSLNLKG